MTAAMTEAEKKISAFCARRGLAYEWQPLKYNGRRAVIESLDRYQHESIMAASRRLKGVRATEWTCCYGGVWEGRIYLQDAEDGARINAILAEEYARSNKWNQVYNACIVSGMDPSTASRHAESLYPTPDAL